MGGKVFVEKAHILEDLIQDIESTVRSTKFHRLDKSTLSDAERSATLHANDQRSNHHNRNTLDPLQQMKKKYQDNNPHLHALEASREKRERKFPVIMQNVEKAIGSLTEVDKELRLYEEAKYNKTRRQFEEWNSNVHGEIMKKIHSNIESVPSKELNRKKNDDYNKFLTVTNRKPCIFRDIIIESECEFSFLLATLCPTLMEWILIDDPLEPNRRCIKAKTTKLKDPVKISEIKAQAEASMLGGPPQKKQPLGKETLDVQLWAAGQIEATPYGTFARMMNKKGDQSEDKMVQEKNATLRSNIHFDHFTFPKGKEAIDAEMPKGKRIHPEMVYSDPSRVFGNLPPDVEREIATIRPPDNRPNFFG